MMDKPTIETVDQARQGETSNRMRWVLLFTMILSIVAVGAVWLWLIKP